MGVSKLTRLYFLPMAECSRKYFTQWDLFVEMTDDDYISSCDSLSDLMGLSPDDPHPNLDLRLIKGIDTRGA